MRYKKIRYFRFLLALLLGLLPGCWLAQQESAGDDSGRAELLRKGVHGTRTLQGYSTTWITNRTTLQQVFTALNKRQLKNGEVLPDINFEVYGVLFLEMGQRPTGGFSINFNPSLTRIVGGQLSIHIDWVVPKEGKLVTQVVTSPFILLKIMHTNIDSILIWDQNKTSLFKIPIET